MEKHFFIAELKANIELSDSDFNLLLKCSRSHYDSTVQSASMVGGFLYGINNRRNWSKNNSEIDLSTEFTYRQIDTMLKSLEFVNTKEALKLMVRLTTIVSDMLAKNNEINKQLVTNEIPSNHE